MRTRWIVPAAACFALLVLTSERTPQDDRPYWRTNLLERIAADQGFLIARWWPEQMEDPRFRSTLATGVAIAMHGASDAGWERAVSGHASPLVQGLSHESTRFGDGPVVAVWLAFTYAAARAIGDDRLAETASLATESLCDAGIWTALLKSATARVRPHRPLEGRFFEYGAPQHGSFPSGHAMVAFSVASVFADEYRDTRCVPWISYGLASLVGIGRVALGRHYPSDVVVGAVLGTSIGHFVSARNAARSGLQPGPRGALPTEPAPRRLRAAAAGRTLSGLRFP